MWKNAEKWRVCTLRHLRPQPNARPVAEICRIVVVMRSPELLPTTEKSKVDWFCHQKMCKV